MAVLYGGDPVSGGAGPTNIIGNPLDVTDPTLEKRLARQSRTGRPRPRPKPKPNLPEIDPLAALMAQQKAMLDAQQKLQNAAQSAELENLIAQLRADETGGTSDINAQLSEVGRQAELSRGEAQRGATTQGAIGRRMLAGRGLALSGVRLGQESRNQADLVGSLGRISSGAQVSSDALRRALEGLQSGTARRVAEAQAQLRGLK